jgi:two-component system LytT family response regulator
MLTAFLVDDEILALDRLERLLAEDGRVRVMGRSQDPVEAAAAIDETNPNVLFLDIQMPERDGFALLAGLKRQPLVVFVTAFDGYALKAFETNGVAYLLKPVAPAKLSAAIDKVSRIAGGAEAPPDFRSIFAELEKKIAKPSGASYPARISSRTGDRVEFIDLTRVTHFYADDKLTFAATDAKHYALDWTISQLAEKLDPNRFQRVHRGTIVNLEAVSELYSYFGGKWIVKLKDGKTQVTVAKERARELREKLGL